MKVEQAMVLELEKQVTSLELSKELKELDVNQNTLFSWIEYPDGTFHVELTKYAISLGEKEKELFAAFTVAEHGEALPFNYTALKHMSMEKWFGVEFFMGDTAKSIGVDAKTEVDARAKIRIYLIKEGIIKVNEK